MKCWRMYAAPERWKIATRVHYGAGLTYLQTDPAIILSLIPNDPEIQCSDTGESPCAPGFPESCKGCLHHRINMDRTRASLYRGRAGANRGDCPLIPRHSI